MSKILIGSRAAKHWWPDFPREPEDFDYISDEPQTEKEDSHWNDGVAYLAGKYPDVIAGPNTLYTLKLSHVYFLPDKFNKTIFDIVWMQNKDCVVDEDLYERLYKQWEHTHGAKKAKLTENNESFFKNTVNRVYEHDSLHDAMKYYDEPMFQKIKIDKTKAQVSKKLFLELPRQDQINLCLEEIHVVALERFLIPREFRMHPKAARAEAVKLLVTSMSKGWFPRFICENFSCIHVKNNNNDFVERFNVALKNNLIKAI